MCNLNNMTHKLIKTDNYLWVVDDSEIIEDCYAIHHHPTGELELVSHNHKYGCKLCKKIISHLPLNGSPILEGVDLLPPYNKEYDIEELFNNTWLGEKVCYNSDIGISFKEGYNKAREVFISKIEKQILNNSYYNDSPRLKEGAMMVKVMLESTNQYPTEFISDDEISHGGSGTYSTDLMDIGVSNLKPIKVPRTITTAQGVQWVGKYK